MAAAGGDLRGGWAGACGAVRPSGAIPPTALCLRAPPVHAATGGYAVRSPPAAQLPDARQQKRARSPFSGDTLPKESR